MCKRCVLAFIRPGKSLISIRWPLQSPPEDRQRYDYDGIYSFQEDIKGRPLASLIRPHQVLVLDGHTNQALAAVRSLGRAGHMPYVVSHRRAPLAAWSRHCRQSLHVTGQSLEGMETARRWARERGIQVVMPMTERSCTLVNLSRAQWVDDGFVAGCAPAATLNQAFDKGATLAIARSAKVSCPETSLPGSLEEAVAAAERFEWRCVVKSRRSHAWDGQRFLPDLACAYPTSPDDLVLAIEQRRQGSTWPLVQRLVPGVGKGVFTLWDHGRPLAWFAHERLRDIRPTGSGSSLRRAIALDPRLRVPAERLLHALQWHGPAMVEFRDDGVTPWLMEVNGRFWTSLQLAVDAGVDFPELWLRALIQSGIEGEHDNYQTGVTLRWLWGDAKRLIYIAAGRPAGFAGPFPTLRQGLAEVLGRQPTGTRTEMWRKDDPWPAVGEWVQGIGDLLARREVTNQLQNDTAHSQQAGSESHMSPRS